MSCWCCWRLDEIQYLSRLNFNRIKNSQRVRQYLNVTSFFHSFNERSPDMRCVNCCCRNKNNSYIHRSANHHLNAPTELPSPSIVTDGELGHMMLGANSIKELVEHTDSRTDEATPSWNLNTSHMFNKHVSAESDELRLKVDLLDGKCQEFFPIILQDIKNLVIIRDFLVYRPKKFWMIGRDKNLLQVCLQLLPQ